jgi:hypothetical protein
MRMLTAAFVYFVLAACTQAQPGPADVVRTIYEEAEARVSRNQVTGETDLPLTEDFARTLAQASEAAQRRDEPFIDGDLALDCQECTGLGGLSIATTTPPANGRAVVEARFRIAERDRVVIWDMKETPEGWRVDNIRGPNDHNLRAAAQDELRPQSAGP